MGAERSEKHGLLEELLTVAIRNLETIAARQKSAQLASVAAGMKAGKIAEAEPVFKSVAETYAGANLPASLKIAAWIDLAAVTLATDREKAVAALDKALALDTDDPASLVFLARIRIEDRDFAAAGELLARLATLPESEQNKRWIAIGLEDQGIVHHVAGRLDAAADCYRGASERFRALDDRPRLAETLGNLGLVHRRKGDLSGAERLFAESLGLWKGLDAEQETARTLGYLASVHFAANRFDQAMALFAERSLLNRKLGDEAEVAADHANIGLASMRKGDRAEACRHFTEALKLYRGLGRAKESEAVAALLLKHGCAKAHAA